MRICDAYEIPLVFVVDTPTARIAVIGAEAAISLLYHRELEAAGEEQDAMRQQLVDAYNENVVTPYSAAERGYIDAVIEPSATRLEIRRALTLLRDKRSARGEQKHHLIPL